MKKACTLLITILLISLADNCYAQAPAIPIPQLGLPNTPKPTAPTNRSIYPHIPNSGFNQQAQQAALLREMQQHQRQLQESANNEPKTIFKTKYNVRPI